MKKLLFLSQLYPYPPDGGGKIKTLNTLRALTPHFRIHAVFISEENPAKSDLWQLEKLGIMVKVFYSDTILASVKDDFPGLFWHFIRGIPHYVFQYTHRPAFPYIEKAIKDFQPNIIHVDHLNLAQYLPILKRHVCVLEHHNVETYLYWTRFLHSRKFTRKLYLLIEMVLTFVFEYRTLRRFDHIFTISEPEAKRTQQIFRVRNVTAQPLVFPITRITRKLAKQPYILFIGNLGWPPNEDAIEWFLRSIWPSVCSELPNAEFHVVGKRQPRYEKNWPKYANVFLHGYQKSLFPYLTQAHVFVLPFRMGGGLRLKSLTALSAGLPLVSTSLGVEGLHVRDSREFLLAESGVDFANKVIYLLRSGKTQQNLSKYALEYMKRHHSLRQNKIFIKRYFEITQRFS